MRKNYNKKLQKHGVFSKSATAVALFYLGLPKSTLKHSASTIFAETMLFKMLYILASKFTSIIPRSPYRTNIIKQEKSRKALDYAPFYQK